MTDQLLQVRIVSPKETLFEGRAASVSSVNSVGAFDILPEHAKFVTIVQSKPLIVRLSDHTQKQFSFPLAIIHAHEGKVDIYTPLSDKLTING